MSGSLFPVGPPLIRSGSVIGQDAFLDSFRNDWGTKPSYMTQHFPDRPKISILMLTYNRIDQVIPCLKSLELVKTDFHELVIIDNGSQDGTKEWIENEYQSPVPFKFIKSSVNLGVSGGRQELVSKADPSSDLLLFMDSDVLVTNKILLWFISNFFTNSPAVGVVGGGGSFINWKHDHPFEPAPPGLCDVVQGWCMAVNRIIFHGASFDPNYYPRWEEDSDLCLQTRSLGYDVISAPLGGMISHQPGNSGANEANRAKTLRYFRDKWAGKALTRAEGGY